MLSLDDLPPEGRYFLPGSGWMTPHLNSEIIQDMGAEKGEKYISDTGRVEGWLVDYLRRSSTYPGPEEVYNNVIRFQSIAGVQVYMSEYSHSDAVETGFSEIQDHPIIGDASREYIKLDGGKQLFRLEFASRNYIQRLVVYGLPSEASAEWTRNLVKKLLAKLTRAPLSAQ